jgi:hypothetical protein
MAVTLGIIAFFAPKGAERQYNAADFIGEMIQEAKRPPARLPD